MVLVERNAHLSRLHELRVETADRKGRVVVVQGPPVTGRTELLRAFAEEAEEAGFMFLSATCSAQERTLRLGVMSQLWHSAALPADLTERAVRLVDEELSRPATTAESVEVLHRLCIATLDLAATDPLLIGVDDLRYADEESLRCLLHLVRRSAAARIMLVLTDDTDEQVPHAGFRSELMRQPHVELMRLAPLSEAGVATLLSIEDSGLSAVELKRRAAELHHATGGNPVLLRGLLEDADGFASATAPGAPAGAGFRRAMLRCLRSWDATALHVLRALAILDDSAGVKEVARLAEMPVRTVERVLETATGSGLLDDGRFRLPAARETVLADLPDETRARWHRQAAELLHVAGAPAVRIAGHLVQAGDAPDEPWVRSTTLEAAEQALLAGRAEFAVQCLEITLGCATDPTQRAAVLARLAHAEWLLNPATAVRRLAPLVEAARGDQLDRPQCLVLIRQLLWHGWMADATELLGRIRAGQQNRPDEPGNSELRDLELWLAGLYPPLAQRRVIVAPAPSRQNMFATLGADPWLRSSTLLADLLTRRDDSDAVARAEDVLRGRHLSRETSWTEESVLLALLLLVYAGRLTTAAEWCDRLISETPQPRTAQRAMAIAVRAEVLLRQGDLPGAAEAARVALQLPTHRAWGTAIGLPMSTLILACTRMGDYDEATRLLTLSVPEPLYSSRYGLHYLHARGQYHLAVNHHHAALADFRSCGELMRSWGLDVAGLVPWRTSAAEAWLRLGNRDQARTLIFEQLGRPGLDATRGVALRLLAMISSPSRRLELLGEAVDLFESAGDRYEQGRVLAELSRAYNALNQKRRARLLFRRALHVAEMCGATPLSRHLLAVSDETTDSTAPSGRSTAIDSLTGSERRVASLAVMGYTNREIAAKLFVTASTVEQHLTRVYRKLNVKSRRDLPTDLWAELTRTG